MDNLKDVARYCAENIEDWPEKSELALNYIGKRMPIDPGFRNEIEDCVAEWCDENEVSLDFFEDWDKIVEEIIMYKS